MPQKNVFGKPEDCSQVLLHACCAPCSAAIVEWLVSNGVRPTIFYYNPNIWPREEYEIRKRESQRHAEALGIRWIDGDYDHERWCCQMRGCEQEPERGGRCLRCFALRLTEAARQAQRLGIRYFATTLASSRWKSLEQICQAGMLAQERVEGTIFWAQNWRKGGLQQRRNQLLKEMGFYNQTYCGCEFSLTSKPLLRQLMRERKIQYAQDMPQWSRQIVARLQETIEGARVVMGYWPLADEVDIRPLIDWLVQEGKTVLLPRVTGPETMELRRYTATSDLSPGAFGIMEPAGEAFDHTTSVDTVLVPGMAFDARGNRLGRGRGYYDRLLPRLPQARKVGVCFPFQMVARVPAVETDAAVDEVVTMRGIR